MVPQRLFQEKVRLDDFEEDRIVSTNDIPQEHYAIPPPRPPFLGKVTSRLPANLEKPSGADYDCLCIPHSALRIKTD
jgi:hypothetical protein